MNIVNYAAKYLRNLTGLKTISIKKIYNQYDTLPARAKEFFPLYIAIANKVPPMDIEIVEKVFMYKDVIDGKQTHDFYSKFLNSYEITKNKKSNDIKVKELYVDNILKLINDYDLSTAQINRDIGINLKIINQIKKKEIPSMSTNTLKSNYKKMISVYRVA